MRNPKIEEAIVAVTQKQNECKKNSQKIRYIYDYNDICRTNTNFYYYGATL